jgi:glycosyltransferase involved in cell wall biosynthesis
MRIGISTSVIQHGKTGIAEYLFSLVRAFGERAKEHQFVLFVLERDLPLFEFASNRTQLVTVPERFRSPVRDILWHQVFLPRMAKEHRLDVIHVPSYRRLPWRKLCALVGTVHDLAAFHIPGKYDWKRMFYGRVVAARLAQRQDQVIAVSRHTARDIATFWKVPADHITVIYHGIDHRRFSEASKESAQRLCRHRFGLFEPFFLYVARLEHPAKNHVRLIRAFDRFKTQTGLPWQLVLAGSDWHGARQIHKAVEDSPARRDIRCLGFVAEADLPLLYRNAEVFVYPSLHEGFGFPPLEAMASGCPVLCSVRGALGEIVNGAALTANPENVSEWAGQMVRVARDESLRAELAARGIARAGQFDWGRTATATLNVYARAMSRASARTKQAGRPAQSTIASDLWKAEVRQ